MALIVAIPILCFLASFVHIFTKKVFGSREFNSRVERERELKKCIQEKRMELSRVSMVDDYTEYVKLERKKIELEELLKEVQIQRENALNKNTIRKYFISYGLNGLLTLALLCISVYHRGTPIIRFGNEYNFTPFTQLMAFPTGQSNVISVPFFIFASSFVMRSCAGYVK